MELKDKAEILLQFIQEEFNNPLYDTFFGYNDLGIPLAVSFSEDLCILTDDGKEILNETYRLLCEELGLDEKYYGSYSEMKQLSETD